MRNIFVAAFVLAAAAPAFASDAWNVIEGPQGSQKGTWTLVTAGAVVTGTAKMAGPHGEPVAYQVTGRLEKGVYTLARQASSDRRDCMYRGAMKDDGSIAGSATCDGEQGPWIARPAHK